MTTKSYQNIIYEKKPPIAYIILNRPEKMNAFSQELQDEFNEAIEDAGWADDAIRVIVVKGNGRCFSAGFDMSGGGLKNADAVMIRERMLGPNRFTGGTFFDRIWRNPKPIISQVHGFALAAGAGLANMCDLCICAEDALFGYPRIRDSGPFLWATQPWQIGMRKAKYLQFTGDLMDAQEAYRLGMINKVVTKDKLDEEVTKLALTISKIDAIVLKYAKIAVNMAYDLMGIRQVLERTQELEATTLASTEASVPEIGKFKKLSREQGLGAALSYRKGKFEEEDRWWKERLQKK